MLQLLLKPSLLAVLGAALLLADAHGQAPPLAIIALPPPGDARPLYIGWNNVALTFPDSTPAGIVASAVDPQAALNSVWHYDAQGQRWDGFDPQAPPAVNTLDSVDFLDAVFVHISPSPQAPYPTQEVETEIVAEGLEFPVSIAFAPDGRIFYNERLTGRIRIIQEGQVLPEPFAQLDVVTRAETGLLGLTLDPAFQENGFLYVYHTYQAGGGIRNRVARFRAQGNQGVEMEVILDGIPAAAIHNGGILEFGPDGKLYVATGDATQRRRAQDVDFLGGKTLRLNPDGAIAEDNPFPGSPVYSLGHRNVFGMAFRPQTGALYITENGPASDDEINLVTAGGNYGWPEVLGVANDQRYIDPIATYTPVIAPTEADFYSGDVYPQQYRGNLFFGDW
ncbi:MAG: PQQ-dependent sugar dehydrogenase, partial [Dehalococcoidia bacterium]